MSSLHSLFGWNQKPVISNAHGDDNNVSQESKVSLCSIGSTAEQEKLVLFNFFERKIYLILDTVLKTYVQKDILYFIKSRVNGLRG